LTQFKTLFAPICIGQLEIKNRCVVPAMGTSFGNEDSTVSEQMVNYYSERARGGFGLIVSEVCSVDPLGKAGPREFGIWDDKFMPGLTRLVDEVHQQGSKIVVQLHHGGRQVPPNAIEGNQPVAPSAVPCPLIQVTPHEMTAEEVWAMIGQFRVAALRAKAIGFDGVEVHGAHGYLVAQFMSAHSNKRYDEFGGGLTGRMKFPIEIVRAIRESAGPDFPIIFRISGDEMVYGGRAIHETLAACMLLEEAGVDCFDISVCTYGSLEWMCAPSAVAPGFNSTAAEEVKKVVSKPVIAVGRINDPALAESILRSNKADLIAFGRESIADPELPNKLAEGRVDEVRPCLACLQGCLTGVFIPGGRLGCVVNPFVGREGSSDLGPCKRSKKVMVVGAGPAGLEAAWIAALRGHDVTCYEKKSVIGGQFRIAAIPPTKQELAVALKQLLSLCNKYGVKLKLGTEVTADLLVQEKPQIVILATGAEPFIPAIPGIRESGAVLANDVIDAKVQVGHRVLVIGGGMVGAETADYLRDYGKSITIVDMLSDIAADMPLGPRKWLLRRLAEGHVEFVTNATVKRVFDDGILYERDTQQYDARGFDSVVIALGSRATNPLGALIPPEVEEVHVIGDCKKARHVSDATSEAADVALSI